MQGASSTSYPAQNHTPVAKHFRSSVLNTRFGTTEDPHFASINLTSQLFKAHIDDSEHVKMEVWHAPGRSKPTFTQAVRAKYHPLKIGDKFGPSWTNHWVRIHLTVPKEYHKEEPVQLEFDPSCEAMVFNTEGRPLQGITGGNGSERRVEFILKDPTYSQTFYIEVSANGLFGVGEGDQEGGDDNRYFTLETAAIVIPRMEAWHLLWDFRTLKDLAKGLPSDSRLGNKAMSVANEMLNVFRHDDHATIGKARKVAEKVLGKGWQEKGADVFEGTDDEQIFAMSNCHIDTAWLWPFRVTQQKTARSWSTQCDLMERYPEHRFVASQAQQFKWLEQQYPLLFDVIKSKVEAGTFMPIGGSWVENDTNMPSGESLCRQMIFGQRYFKSRFGKYCDVHWLPDTFGYSSQLPQICRLAGMPSFFTQKLSWSQFNDFPHTTFNWVGLDGSQVLTHMTPVNTYNASACVQDCINGIKNHKNLEVTDISLLPFGNGDGGGGAVPPMLESLRRIRAVANNNPELAKIGYGKGRDVSEMYQAILKQTDDGKKLPTWIGELYLEFHRGTYTSHGSIKKHNRKCEILLKELEYVATLASLHAEKSGSKYSYPKDKIDPLWEKVLLCQFHDVLPGSAIAMVYEDAEDLYAEVHKQGAELMEEAIKALVPGSPSKDVSANHDSIFALNVLGEPRKEIVQVRQSSRSTMFGSAIVQKDGEGTLLVMEDIDGSGIMRPSTADHPIASCKRSEDGHILSNESLRVSINAKGRITSIFDIQQSRELVSPNQTAGFVIYQDMPGRFDAWDVDIYHLETPQQLYAESVSVSSSGPLRASVTTDYKHGKSSWKTTISLDAIATSGDALSMIRFETDIDWHTQHQFLKWEMPVEIFSQEAFYETQFGFLSRPTHRNTSWDAAKFEVCAHKYIDLSEYGYGVAMLNDCKYGFAVAGNVMRISLLRGATGPDPNQDQGKHSFSFAVLPHRGHFLQTSVPQLAAAFNMPLHVQHTTSADLQAFRADVHGPFKVQHAPNVILDTIKRGEDDDFLSHHSSKSVICRLYESKGGHARASLSTSLPVRKATIVDLLERKLEDLDLVKDASGRASVKLPFRGFQVVTVKFELGTSTETEWTEV